MPDSDNITAGALNRISSRTILIGLLGVALLLRLPGMLTDFWLDEAWSVFSARLAQSVGDLFVGFGVSNHRLNEIIFYLMGDQPVWHLYRMPALIAGVASVGMAWLIGARRGRIDAFLAALLTTASYLMIHYSSEARGYTMVIFFALAAYYAIGQYLASRKLIWPVVVWISVCLGFLAQLIFIHVFAALGAWLVARIAQSGDRATAARDGIVCLGVPTVLLGVFHLFILRHLPTGAGPDYELGAVLVKTFSYAMGGPPAGPIAVAFAACAAVLLLSALWFMYRTTKDDWVFFAVVILVSPLVLLLAVTPEELFVRYFLINIAFGYLVLAFLLADSIRRTGARRVAGLVVLIGFLAGNAFDVGRFYRYGRGAYLDTLRFMVAESPRSPVTVAGDYDFRHNLIIEFYRRYLPQEKPIVYVERRKLSGTSPQWYLMHSIGERIAAPAQIADGKGHPYRLVREIPYSDLSGWHWYLYKRRAD